jgi:peptide/nickel transport system ATP-binding protein
MAEAASAKDPTLSIRDLRIAFPGREVVSGVNITVAPGEIVAVIGESGSGKTLTALAVLGLLPRQAAVTEGAISLNRRPMLDLTSSERRALLGDRLAFIPQDAMRALNPVLTVGDQVAEPAVLHRGSPWVAARRMAVDLLRSVHLAEPERRVGDFPHQFSGGMQQRAMIAMGLALEPELLIADEPTTALDVTVQAQVIKLLREIRDEHGTSIFFITHDLGLVADFCDRVYVMYAGRIVEEGPVARIFAAPRHPYTAALLAATPSVIDAADQLDAIPGQIPAAGEHIEGCVFRPRCMRAAEQCRNDPPEADFGEGHSARCWHPKEPA